jgi:hypothetical protein
MRSPSCVSSSVCVFQSHHAFWDPPVGRTTSFRVARTTRSVAARAPSSRRGRPFRVGKPDSFGERAEWPRGARSRPTCATDEDRYRSVPRSTAAAQNCRYDRRARRARAVRRAPSVSSQSGGYSSGPFGAVNDSKLRARSNDFAAVVPRCASIRRAERPLTSGPVPTARERRQRSLPWGTPMGPRPRSSLARAQSGNGCSGQRCPQPRDETKPRTRERCGGDRAVRQSGPSPASSRHRPGGPSHPPGPPAQ